MYKTTSTVISGDVISVSIEVDGVPATIYRAMGQYWVESKLGSRFAIVVRNLVGGRIEVLESVDGRDVLEDQAADLSNRGMVIKSLWRNEGWLVSKRQTNDFVFTYAGDPNSIVEQTADPDGNEGVIGVAVFTERVALRRDRIEPFAHYKGINLESTRGGDSLTMGVEPSDSATGMGQAREVNVGNTTFERATTYPAELFQIQYRTRAWLLRNGIIGNESKLPQAFPGKPTGYMKYTR